MEQVSGEHLLDHGPLGLGGNTGKLLKDKQIHHLDLNRKLAMQIKYVKITTKYFYDGLPGE